MDQMKLGMEVGLGPDHIVLDGDVAPSPQKKRVDVRMCVYACVGG